MPVKIKKNNGHIHQGFFGRANGMGSALWHFMQFVLTCTSAQGHQLLVMLMSATPPLWPNFAWAITLRGFLFTGTSLREPVFSIARWIRGSPCLVSVSSVGGAMVRQPRSRNKRTAASVFISSHPRSSAG